MIDSVMSPTLEILSCYGIRLCQSNGGNEIDWLTGELLTWAGLAFVWLLTSLPPSFDYFGYTVFAICLTDGYPIMFR